MNSPVETSNLLFKYIVTVLDYQKKLDFFRQEINNLIEFDVTKNREIINCYMGTEPKEFEKLFTPEQWDKYLKSGALRDKKARDKRAAKREK